MTNVADRRAARRVTPSAARFAERARARRRRIVRRLLGALLAVALVAGCVWLVGFSSVLTVTHVRVEGVSGEEAGALRAIGEETVGRPLARVDTGAVAEQARARRAIAEASVSRSWPHTLVITAVHRTPALVLQNPDGGLEVVDSSGVRYAEVSTRPAGVPVVTAASSAGVSDDALAAALSVVRALPPSLDGDVSDITVSSANLVTFRHGRTEVVWGGAGEESLKIRIIEALLKSTPTPSVIDVSAPQTPVSK
ncbi:Cell division protein FtsQ [Nostocoides japonicum T1-X7]|uniref:Cell division protein FtsQ n=1 Tax=Nostocoides japonicum T1-X7 TaxID=1194083 RepID=A0A077M7K5_9MICO|nr:FtsQ-type POTRA domain-containing protein [Tetrasphaera japonica]CCH80104.1 Cell division protein FtsQ [Tetrasphaera japonica T1-X7]